MAGPALAGGARVFDCMTRCHRTDNGFRIDTGTWSRQNYHANLCICKACAALSSFWHVLCITASIRMDTLLLCGDFRSSSGVNSMKRFVFLMLAVGAMAAFGASQASAQCYGGGYGGGYYGGHRGGHHGYARHHYGHRYGHHYRNHYRPQIYHHGGYGHYGHGYPRTSLYYGRSYGGRGYGYGRSGWGFGISF